MLNEHQLILWETRSNGDELFVDMPYVESATLLRYKEAFPHLHLNKK